MFLNAAKTSEIIDISRKNFAFDLSKASFMGETLQELDISRNGIWGSIPSRITDCVFNLVKIELSFLSSLEAAFNCAKS